MSSQKYFNYEFSITKVNENYFVNQTNQKAYDLTILKNLSSFLLFSSEEMEPSQAQAQAQGLL